MDLFDFWFDPSKRYVEVLRCMHQNALQSIRKMFIVFHDDFEDPWDDLKEIRQLEEVLVDWEFPCRPRYPGQRFTEVTDTERYFNFLHLHKRPH